MWLYDQTHETSLMCMNCSEISSVWKLMRTCLCLIPFSGCGLSGQERESVDPEEDEVGRSFCSAGSSAGGDGTGVLNASHLTRRTHLYWLRDCVPERFFSTETLPSSRCDRLSCNSEPDRAAWTDCVQQERVSFHLAVHSRVWFSVSLNSLVFYGYCSYDCPYACYYDYCNYCLVVSEFNFRSVCELPPVTGMCWFFTFQALKP